MGAPPAATAPASAPAPQPPAPAAAESSAQPEAQPDAAAEDGEFNIESVVSERRESERAKKAAKKKKSGLAATIAMILGLLAAVGGVGALMVYLWNNFHGEEPETKAPVAMAPKKTLEKTKEQKTEPEKTVDTSFDLSAIKPGEMGEGGFGRTGFELPTPSAPRGRIDELVFARLKQLEIEPANPCSDTVFLRRVYLDVIGTLPTVDEAKAFLADKDPNKRDKLIDALLERPEFADFWAMKWCDLLRVKAEFPINLWPNAAQAYHRWIHHAVKTNMPYDKFVRELLTSSGSNFRVAQVNFYRALQSRDPKGVSRAVALTFMGSRVDKWPPEKLAGMSAFFLKVGYKPTGEWKEEVVIFDPHKTDPPKPSDKPGEKKPEKKPGEKKAKPAPLPSPVFPDGTPVEIAWDKDPRVVFADWLIRGDNPAFTRPIVNRIWYWLQGRGIVQEPDDFRDDNPPSNPELLDYLAAELVKSNYDLKHVYRLILKSSTYQFSSIPKSKKPEAAVNFASYTVRRLEAEVIIDALNQITGTTESYSSIIPEPYTFIPETRRAIALPDGSITSSFLELFGRPPRDSGMESERNNRITAGQRLHMLNSSHVRDKLQKGPGLQKLLQGNPTENIYLAILSRPPVMGEGGSGESLAWTLINTTEFLYRH